MLRKLLSSFVVAIVAMPPLASVARADTLAQLEASYMAAHSEYLKATSGTCVDSDVRDKALAANDAAWKQNLDNWPNPFKGTGDKVAHEKAESDWKYVNKMVLSLMSERDAINRMPLCAKTGLKPVVPPIGPSTQPPEEKEVKKPCITQADIDRKYIELSGLEVKAKNLSHAIEDKKDERDAKEAALAELNKYFDEKGKLKPTYVKDPDLVPEKYHDMDPVAERAELTAARDAAVLEIERLTNEWIGIAKDVERIKDDIKQMEEQLKAQDCGPKTATPLPPKPPATKSGRSHDKGKKIPVVQRKDENRITTTDDNRTTTREDNRIVTTREDNRLTTSRRNEAAEEQQRRATTDALVTGVVIGTSVGMSFGGGRHEHAPVERSGFGGGGMGFQMR